MSRDYTDYNKDIDSDAASAHRQSFIERMERKLAAKEIIADSRG
ncbi:MAG TPA: hypothetical protein VF572_05810 [Candidatus Saccharimonadales bacterium]|jgi:hypothetical protein